MSKIIKPQGKINSIDTLDDVIGKKRLLIFDMDGTLLDSMEFWQNLGRQYLESKGKSPDDDLEDVIESMTLQESASYFKKKYDLDEDTEEIIKEVLDFIEDKYLNEIPKPKFRRMVVSKELYELLKKNFPDDFIFG